MLDMSLPEMLAKLSVVRQRPSRIVDYFREPRSLVIGGAVANRLGLQVARLCLEDVAWHARRERVSETVREAYDVMTRDGILVVRDFLPTVEFEGVLAEFEKSRSEAQLPRYKVRMFGDNYVDEQLPITDWAEDYPHTIRAFRDNPFILRLVSAVTRRDISYRPLIALQYLRKPEPDSPHTDYDDAQCSHTDRHYNFVKAFFYLRDVTEADAPYTYVPGSHRTTLARAEYEYDLSLRYVRAEAGRVSNGSRMAPAVQSQLERARQIYADSDVLVAKMGLKEVPICGKANTLIISNNKGLHRRGEMRSGRPRVSINLDFKYLESMAHHLYPVFKYLSE